MKSIVLFSLFCILRFFVGDSALAQSSSVGGAREHSERAYGDTITELKLISDQAIVNATKESKSKFEDDPGKAFSGCKRIDLFVYKQANPYFETKFEMAVNACLNSQVPVARQIWESLDYAKKKDIPAVYSVALENVRDKAYRRSDSRSPYRQWVDIVVDSFEGGLSRAETAREGYLACLKWAEIDADLVLLSEAPYEDDLDRDIDRGSLVCDG